MVSLTCMQTRHALYQVLISQLVLKCTRPSFYVNSTQTNLLKQKLLTVVLRSFLLYTFYSDLCPFHISLSALLLYSEQTDEKLNAYVTISRLSLFKANQIRYFCLLFGFLGMTFFFFFILSIHLVFDIFLYECTRDAFTFN